MYTEDSSKPCRLSMEETERHGSGFGYNTTRAAQSTMLLPMNKPMSNLATPQLASSAVAGWGLFFSFLNDGQRSRKSSPIPRRNSWQLTTFRMVHVASVDKMLNCEEGCKANHCLSHKMMFNASNKNSTIAVKRRAVALQSFSGEIALILELFLRNNVWNCAGKRNGSHKSYYRRMQCGSKSITQSPSVSTSNRCTKDPLFQGWLRCIFKVFKQDSTYLDILLVIP